MFMPPPLRPEPDLPALQIYIPTQMHEVTEKEMQAFLKNPLELLGKRFMLKGARQDDLHYEVVKFRTSKGETHCYGVQYADCVSAVEMDAGELRMHLQESYLIDATPTMVLCESLLDRDENLFAGLSNPNSPVEVPLVTTANPTGSGSAPNSGGK